MGLSKVRNKKPLGPHLVHLSTMCNLCDGSTKAPVLCFIIGHLIFLIGLKNTNLVDNLASSQVSLNSTQLIQRRSRKCLSQSCFSHLTEKYKLVMLEDIEILLPVKFLRIPFSGLRGEVENVSANQSPRRPSCFSDQPEKQTCTCRGCWDLASCQVSMNSVQWFQRSQKCEKLNDEWTTYGRTTDKMWSQ